MAVECRKCGRMRSEQFMQEAVFRNFVGDEPAGVWQCGSSASCRQERKKCPKCGHRKSHHVNHANWFGNRKNVVACYENMGMGACGCEKYDKGHNDYADGHTYDRT